jgi:hypothetical protein
MIKRLSKFWYLCREGFDELKQMIMVSARLQNAAMLKPVMKRKQRKLRKINDDCQGELAAEALYMLILK